MNTRCFTAPLGLSKVIEFNIELKLVNFQATENGIWQMSHAQVTGGVDIDMQARKKKNGITAPAEQFAHLFFWNDAADTVS